MIGNVFVTESRSVGGRLLAHEARHADQWAIFGRGFGSMCIGAHIAAGECSVLRHGWDTGMVVIVGVRRLAV